VERYYIRVLRSLPKEKGSKTNSRFSRINARSQHLDILSFLRTRGTAQSNRETRNDESIRSAERERERERREVSFPPSRLGEQAKSVSRGRRIDIRSRCARLPEKYCPFRRQATARGGRRGEMQCSSRGTQSAQMLRVFFAGEQPPRLRHAEKMSGRGRLHGSDANLRRGRGHTLRPHVPQEGEEEEE